MRIKLVFLEQNIYRFTGFLNMILKSSFKEVTGIIMTITKERITVVYDYILLTEDIKVIDFSNTENENFVYAYYYYDLNLVPINNIAQTIDEIVLSNGTNNNVPIEEATIRFSLEYVKEIISLASDKNSKSLCIKAIKNHNTSDFFKTLFDVHVIMADQIEKTLTFPFRSRVNSIKLNEINYGTDLIEFNHLLSILKNVGYKTIKKGLKVVLLYFKKESDKFNLIYQFDRSSFRSLYFASEDVSCYSDEDIVMKTYAIIPNSLNRLFPGTINEDYSLIEELFLSNEYITMKLSCACVNKKDGTQLSEVYSQAIQSIRIKELSPEEVMEINELNNHNDD